MQNAMESRCNCYFLTCVTLSPKNVPYPRKTVNLVYFSRLFLAYDISGLTIASGPYYGLPVPGLMLRLTSNASDIVQLLLDMIDIAYLRQEARATFSKTLCCNISKSLSRWN